MIKTDFVIVGSGLFGSMTAKWFRKMGYDVTIIDCESPFAASKCSFGIWKPGWVNPSIQAEVEMGLPFLDEVTGIEEVTFFNMKKEVEETFLRASRSLILEEEFVKGTVYDIKKGGKEVFYSRGEKKFKIEAKKGCIICVGAFLPMLLVVTGLSVKKMVNVDMHWGATVDIKGVNVENRIKEWAPYRQSVLISDGRGGCVFGDGSSVKNPKNGADERVGKASDRLIHNLNDVLGITLDVNKITSVNEGYRPYLRKDETDFINQHDEFVWSATGGAKNSTILCSYIAQELYKRVQA